MDKKKLKLPLVLRQIPDTAKHITLMFTAWKIQLGKRFIMRETGGGKHLLRLTWAQMQHI